MQIRGGEMAERPVLGMAQERGRMIDYQSDNQAGASHSHPCPPEARSRMVHPNNGISLPTLAAKDAVKEGAPAESRMG